MLCGWDAGSLVSLLCQVWLCDKDVNSDSDAVHNNCLFLCITHFLLQTVSICGGIIS
jgi:hypothetical protein